MEPQTKIGVSVGQVGAPRKGTRGRDPLWREHDLHSSKKKRTCWGQ